MTVAIVTLRTLLPDSLSGVAVVAAVGGGVYAITFIAFAVSSEERLTYRVKARDILRRRGHVPAIA
jgi:hypothetical protein